MWYLVLHEVECALMSSGASPLLTHAIAPFQQVNGPNLIAVGIWEILEELDFQLPIEDIQIGQDQYIIEAHQVLCNVCCRVSGQDCTQHSRVTRVSPTNCCCEQTHVGCRMNHLKVAPQDQGFARPIAAASIRMCVAKQIKAGLRPRV